jgi:hypothetical protein
MASQTALKLVEDVAPDTPAFERRIKDRRDVHGHVTAVIRHQGPDGETRNRICSLQLQNMSDAGLGAFVTESIAPDTQMAIFFPPHGPERGIDLYGRVVRCASRSFGHEIGIAFDIRPAA